MYSEKVMEHFQNPKYVGEIEDADGIGEVGNIKCGDVMKLFIKVEDGIIKDIKFKTFGCVAAIAASDALCELAKGKSVDEALKITDKDIAEYLGSLPAIKVHCSVLGKEALQKAIEDYKKKKEKINSVQLP
ncbi:iron-sulfur cluster assembly scaffold protein [Nanoarchaeota archaeon]